MITKNYSISTSKINKSITICLFSDIHYTNTTKLSKLNEIKESIVNNKPDYICIPGDVIDNTNILDNSVKYFNLMNFLKEIGELAPVYISLGNHDTLKITNKTHQYDNILSSHFFSVEIAVLYHTDNMVTKSNHIQALETHAIWLLFHYSISQYFCFQNSTPYPWKIAFR